jgi:predicted NUDIX family NTP pyrophosphohydrolase
VTAKVSAGVLLYRRLPGFADAASGVEIMLVHPGGPFWARKDEGAWTIPKGELGAAEGPLAAARRELFEETGLTAEGAALPLAPVRQAGGKTVHAFAIEQDFDVTTLRSNTFELEWPPRSGVMRTYPEVDRAAWFSPEAARVKLLRGQVPLVDDLLGRLVASDQARR